MRFIRTLVLSLLLLALLGSVFVALIINSNGPPEVLPELTPSQFASKPVVVLNKVENEDINTFIETEVETETAEVSVSSQIPRISGLILE